MTLEEIKIGGLFMFVGDTVLTDIYKKKRKLNSEYWIVGLPNVYDEFAAHRDSRVVSYDTDTARRPTKQFINEKNKRI